MALLACARIGAAHSVVFGGFSAQSLAGRINDAECKVLITADGGWRKGGIVPLKQAADDALADCPSIEHVLVVRRTEHEIGWTEGRDVWYHDLVPARGRLVRARAHERRGHAVPALHLRHDRQAEGHPAHDRRLPARHQGHARARVRHPRRRRLLVHGRHRLGDRALLHRLRAAAEPHDGRDLRGRSRAPVLEPPLGDRAEAQGHDLLHGADRDPRARRAPATTTSRATTSRACACSARSASRSTPRPGCGTTTASAAAAARSSTPGGRPRRARS